MSAPMLPESRVKIDSNRALCYLGDPGRTVIRNRTKALALGTTKT